ncbi:MAG: hypothetical protein M3530_09450 [Thermoproteota archaeon]|nr:hypothetical protein [Thermoproteota archaeon]
MSKGIFSDPLVNIRTGVRVLSFGSFYLPGAIMSGFVKSMRPRRAARLKNSSKNIFFVCPILTIIAMLSVLYYPVNNIALASNPFTLLNPFTTANDICNDGMDNDGDGFVDDNCGTPSLKVTKDPSGAVTNISSICHEDCEID